MTPGGGAAGGGASEASERAGTSGTRDETTGEAAGGEASETSERAGAWPRRTLLERQKER